MASDQVSLLGGGFAYTGRAGRSEELVRLSLSTGSQHGMDASVAAKMTAPEARKLADLLVARAAQAEAVGRPARERTRANQQEGCS